MKNNPASSYIPPLEDEPVKKSFWTNKTVLKIFSALAAVGFWVAISTGAGVEVTETFQNIPIKFDAPFGLKIVSSNPEDIDLQVTGPRWMVGNLNESDIVVTAVTTGVNTSGTYTLQLKASTRQGVSGDFTIHSFSTNTVIAKFDTFTEQSYLITAVPENVVAQEGYALGIETLNVERVKVTGPFSEIQKIKTATARYSAPNGQKINKNFTTTAQIQLLDSEGKEIDMTNVLMDPESVEISVPVLKTKTLPITLNFINAPEGFAEKESEYYTISPDEIEIAGPADVIDNLSSFVVGTLDLSKYLESKTVSYQITAPENVRILSNFNEVDVSLDYSKIKNKKMNITSFAVEGLPAGFSASVVTTRLENVTILAPSSTITSVTESDLVAVVSLQNRQLSPGQIEVSVSIRSKKGRLVWGYGTYTVLVNVQSTG